MKAAKLPSLLMDRPDPKFLDREKLEEEVLELRFKLDEMFVQPPDWMHELKIPPVTRRMLSFMAKHPGKMCSLYALHESLYDKEPTTEVKIVDVLVCKLRKTLKDTDYQIDTVWGQGYIFRKKEQTNDPM